MNILEKIQFLWRTSKEFNKKIEEIHSGQNLSYHNTLSMFCDLLYCYLVYKASPEDYMTFDFYLKRGKVRRGYITNHLGNSISNRFKNDKIIRVIGLKNETLQYFSSFVHRKWLFINYETSHEEIVKFANSVDEYIIKPIDGSMGKGISKQHGSSFLLNIQNEGSFVVEEVLENHPDMAIFNPSSLNTLRVNTCIDNKGELHIFSVGLRVGGQGSICDNIHSGGVCYPVDLESGRISGCGISGDGKHYLVHPSSNIFMLGREIPMFDKVKEYVKALSNSFIEAHWVGWDIAITPNNVELIEANCAPGPISMQINGGKKFEVLKWL